MKNFFGRVFSTIIGIFIFCGIVVAGIFALISISSIGSLFSSDGIQDNSVLEITLEEPIIEYSNEHEFGFLDFEEPATYYYHDIIHMIDAAAEDDKIKGISIKTDGISGGVAQVQGIRNAIEEFKKSGKFVYAYLNNASQKEFYLASVADSLFLNPVGSMEWKGLASEVVFLKNMGEKYGVEFEVIRHGKYKSAVEPYMRDELSEENREQISALLNEIWGEVISDVSRTRNISVEKLNVAADSLLSFSPTKSKEFGLVDALAQESDYNLKLKQALQQEDLEDPLQTVSISKYFSDFSSPYSGKDKIAILYASGAIMNEGEGAMITSEEYKGLIQDLSDNDKIKAVVLRVNSPGGSANASEEIYYELEKLRQKKPVIVSMGNVAASGGYYIAMASDSIFCEPSTITGSIGVLGMVTNFEELAKRNGITSDYVATNANSMEYSPLHGLSEGSNLMLHKMIKETYSIFTQRVMENRKMTFEQVDSLGGGRVWSGIAAKRVGLVDQIGGLDDAIKAAAFKAGLEEFSLYQTPKRENDFLANLKKSPQVSQEEFIKNNLNDSYYQLYQHLKNIQSQQNKIMLIHPYALIIE